MNILIQLSHPAHFHLYKNVAHNLIKNGNNVHILIKSKDILETLLIEANLPYTNIGEKAHRKSKFGILLDLFCRELKIIRYCIKHHITLLTGSTTEVAHIGWLLKRHSINTGEDDASVIPLFIKMVSPFINVFLTPEVCDNGKLNCKSIKYNSYHELAYLHPNHFKADKAVVEQYFRTDKPYFILRFASLKAYHDSGIKGINTEIASRIIDKLKDHGDIYITSERELEPQFEQYRICINPLDMHHVLAFASLYIGDSQTMAAEAAVLGTPFIRFNDFVGRIGYLTELEDKYELGFGIKPSEVDKLYSKLDELLSMTSLKDVFSSRRNKMLSEKIDYAQFLTWFIENYPNSKQIMKDNPDYQYNFR